MREDRASLTAIWVAALRGLSRHDRPGITDDPVARRLLPWPYTMVLGAADRAPFAAQAAMRAAAFVSRDWSRHVALRTRAIDDALTAELRAGARQVILLGAGLDARAFRLDALADAIVFEVDHPATQAHKRERVAHLRPRAREVRFVPMDFERDDLTEELARAGHERGAPTVLVWEGVTMYLAPEAIDATLLAIATMTNPGSCLLATYYDVTSHPGDLALGMLVRLAGEPFKTRMAPEQVRERLARAGFSVESDEGNYEWSVRYLGRGGAPSLERLVRARRVPPVERAQNSEPSKAT